MTSLNLVQNGPAFPYRLVNQVTETMSFRNCNVLYPGPPLIGLLSRGKMFQNNISSAPPPSTSLRSSEKQILST